MKLFKKGVYVFGYSLAALFLVAVYAMYAGYQLIRSLRKPVKSYESLYPDDYINWDDGRA